ncbi:hypothetical protein K8I28_13545 [bacterium]|nr:hypothetical protein [bacterium]
MTIKQIGKRLLHRWNLKLYIFLLSCFLWIFVVHNQQYEVEMDVPLTPVNLKENKIIVSDIPNSVRVRFSGVGTDLQLMRYFQKPSLELDLQTINYFFDYPLRPHYVVVPSGLEATPLEIIDADTVKILLADEEQVRIRVQPRVEVQPQPGYMVVGSVETIPDSVMVSGPRGKVRKIEYLETEEKVFVGVRKEVNELVPITNPNSRELKIKPANVRMSFRVDKIAQYTLKNVPVTAVKEPVGRRVIFDPTRVNLILRGPTETLAALKPDSVQVQVDLSTWQPDRRDYPLLVSLPIGIELVQSDPERVRVRLEVRNR